MRRRPASAAALPVLVAVLALSACKGSGSAHLAKQTGEPDPLEGASTPKLKLVAQRATPVFDKPSLAGTKIGELRAGAIVSRSLEPASSLECPAGFYAIEPRGFVCVGPTASLDPNLIARGLPAGPDSSRVLPYRYARARTENVPLYARAPSPAEQLAAEPDLKKLHAHADAEPLGTAANDVPLDDRGCATGPGVLLPTAEGMEGTKRTSTAFFNFGVESRPPSFAPQGDVKSGGLRKGTTLALTGSLELESASGLRRFGVTTNGELVPVDRLRPVLGSTWHGIDLEKTGLPVAFVYKAGTHPYSLAKSKVTREEDELERRAAIPLSGRFRTVDGMRFEETRDGAWLKASDLIIVVKRHKFPDVAKGNQRWIDVSVATQTLTAYEGTKPVYATLISTGRDQLKDAATSSATPRGMFRVTARHLTRAIDPRDAGNSFDVADAPWVLDVAPVGDGGPVVPAGAKSGPDAALGFSMFGAYFGDIVGEASTFHDVGLAPIDAHRIWVWTKGDMPEGWQATYGEPDGAYVFVRP